MSAYRFCRSDDVPLLVEAHARCYADHVDGERALTPEAFKTAARELGLWASSCMLAIADDRPVGVLLTAKRERESLVVCVGVHPDHRGRGHGRHLLASLSRKAAILGPPRLRAEVPRDLPGGATFLERCGYRPEAAYADFVLDAPAGGAPDVGGLAGPIGLDDLLDSGAWDRGIRRCWERDPETLARRSAEIDGLAVASDRRIEAWVLMRRAPDDGVRELVALGSADPGQSRDLLGILVRHVAGREPSPVRIPRISPDEADFALLGSWGFRRVREWVGLVADASEGA